MLRLLRWLLTGDGHRHEWGWLSTQRICDEDDYLLYHNVYHGCVHCGKYRRQKIEA